MQKSHGSFHFEYFKIQCKTALFTEPSQNPWSLFFNLNEVCNIIEKKDSDTGISPVNSAKCLRASFLQNTFGRLLLSTERRI